ncbi:MAG: heavy metal sensor histidine kinase [Rhodocyclales bacterium]|nr:heavy metal sensor histidine kinase [Rhodocyclales bacterium]
MQGRSITFRLTALFALLASSVLLLMGMLVSRLVEQHFEDLDMAVLNGKQQLVRHALAEVRGEADLVAMSQQLNDAMVGHQGMALALIAADGRSLFVSGDAEFPLAALRDAARPPALQPLIWPTTDGRRFRGFLSEVEAVPGIGGPVQVAVAADMAHHQHFMQSFLVALWAGVLLASLATGFLGWVVVRRGLAPLQAMRQGAAAVTAHRLDFRLAEEAVPVELAALAKTLNEMLARLEDSFRRLSDFSSDLAHELRTPVSNLLTQTQVTLSRPRPAEEYREVLASNAEELERMTRMISDMLFLAKAENGLIVPERQAVDLAGEIRELFEFYDALAEEKGVALSVEGAGVALGDRLMLRRALSNLLANAIRYTPQQGRVVVRIAAADGLARLAVLNSGEPIPEAHRARLFDRFYRAESSRQRSGEEAGLGLAITRSILLAHGGEITVGTEDGMTVFALRLPAA